MQEDRRIGEPLLKGFSLSFGDDETVIKSVVVMVAQPCEYTKNH